MTAFENRKKENVSRIQAFQNERTELKEVTVSQSGQLKYNNVSPEGVTLVYISCKRFFFFTCLTCFCRIITYQLSCCKHTLNLWSCRYITLIGQILLTKTFAIPQIVCLFHVLSTPLTTLLNLKCLVNLLK